MPFVFAGPGAKVSFDRLRTGMKFRPMSGIFSIPRRAGRKGVSGTRVTRNRGGSPARAWPRGGDRGKRSEALRQSSGQASRPLRLGSGPRIRVRGRRASRPLRVGSGRVVIALGWQMESYLYPTIGSLLKWGWRRPTRMGKERVSTPRLEKGAMPKHSHDDRELDIVSKIVISIQPRTQLFP